MKGSGVAMQIKDEVFKSLSNEHNLPIAQETYQDLGKSAYKGEHLENELGLFLSAVKSGVVAKGSILVVYSLDRLSRLEIGYAKQTYYDLTNNGVSVYSMADNHLYRAHNAADDIVSTITFERAHNESKIKSRRVIDSHKEGHKRWKETGESQGNLGRTPLWIDQSTNTFNINAEGVKKAVEMKIAGFGDLKIKQYLDANFEYKPTRKKGRVKQANTWDYTAIYQLWDRRSLFGEKTFRIEGVEYVMENYYPALIDEDTFLKLQASKKRKQGRETASGKISLLKSLCRCGICGGAMVFVDKGGSRVNYVCNLAMKGEHDREVYNVNMLDLLTLEICKDAYLVESDKANNATQESNKLKLEAELVAEKENRVRLLEYCRRTPKESFFELLEESENKIDELEDKLDALNNADVILSADELASLPDIFTDDVRKDYLHPERLAIRNNLYRFISSITLNRRFEPCCDAKTKYANCVDITWHFKNGQKRRLAMLPYEYTKTEVGGKGLYLPFMYMYGSKSLIKVEDGDQLLSDILKKLHKLDLTKCLYPSKGQYQWNRRTLECGKTYWVPLDEGVFLEPEALQFDFGGIHTEKSTPVNYISLMFNHLSEKVEYAHYYPLSKFSDLARGFNFVESYDFYDTLRDNTFDQELYLSRDLLMS
ncbi:TPA: recombinase family protein [Vibrio parahaemolyticus]|nr:recombinase family protein [Vibrio parahaemolyticus]HCE4595147.1 recombinase family protein [Vibrio parahaemolyticus]HCG5927919.1 recombinase family protein [Vibrio parahaemolyticus]HCG6886587.1 recombinase family protein [Vibrio parahaemolyticus]HCG7625233.1 recombinase family protein [Vibrio parahaemolyticus]